MRLVHALLLSIAALLAAPATAQSRHALVVGIDDYAHVEPLQKARNDARAVHGALQAAGFRADLLLDSDGIALLQGLERFVSRIEPGDEAVFFFAGHGVELEGQNILLPADIPAFERGGDLLLRRLGLPVADVLDQMQRRGARVSLLILDACRDNPFPRQGTRSLGGTRGLARMDAPEGAYIMYSAGAGQAALDRLGDDDADPNSVFTRALLPRLSTPGLRLRAMALEVRSEVRQLAMSVGHSQLPAVHDQLDGDFLFLPAGVTPAPSTTLPTAATDPCAVAQTIWGPVQTIDDPDTLAALAAEFGPVCPELATAAQDRFLALGVPPASAHEGLPEPPGIAEILSGTTVPSLHSGIDPALSRIEMEGLRLPSVSASPDMTTAQPTEAVAPLDARDFEIRMFAGRPAAVPPPRPQVFLRPERVLQGIRSLQLLEVPDGHAQDVAAFVRRQHGTGFEPASWEMLSREHVQGPFTLLSLARENAEIMGGVFAARVTFGGQFGTRSNEVFFVTLGDQRPRGRLVAQAANNNRVLRLYLGRDASMPMLVMETQPAGVSRPTGRPEGLERTR